MTPPLTFKMHAPFHLAKRERRRHLTWLLGQNAVFINNSSVSPSFFTLSRTIFLFFYSVICVMTSPMIFTRDGYVILSATKPAMKMKFWHIHSMERLKRELM